MDVLCPGVQEVETNEPLVYITHITHMIVILVKVVILTIAITF